MIFDKKQLESPSNSSTPATTPAPVQLYDRLSQQEKVMIPQWYKLALESAEIVDSTNNIETFLQRYDTMLENLSLIAQIEPRVRFAGKSVKERIDILIAKREKLIANFVIRDFNKAYQKASKLKTERGRTNAIERFFTSAQTMAESCPSITPTIELLRTHIAEHRISEYHISQEETFNAKIICNFAIVYYHGGHIKHCVPQMPGNLFDQTNRYIYYGATNIVVDGVEIDLLDPASISRIPDTKFCAGELTTNLAYQLKMLAIRETNPKIATVLIPKTAELMAVSNIEWAASDYRRLVEQLWKNGLIDEGDALLKKCECNQSSAADSAVSASKARFKETLALCRELRTDLVEMSSHGDTCGECAKYEGRVFSISGTDTRFPPLPKSVFRYGGIHRGCRHSFGAYFMGSPLICGAEDPVTFSNRPFFDDRSDEQKEAYQKYIESISLDDRVWELTSEYYHKRHDDASSVPDSLHEFLRTAK